MANMYVTCSVVPTFFKVVKGKIVVKKRNLFVHGEKRKIVRCIMSIGIHIILSKTKWGKLFIQVACCQILPTRISQSDCVPSSILVNFHLGHGSFNSCNFHPISSAAIQNCSMYRFHME